MARTSMENEILELFFNYPTKQWHFKEVREKVPIADNKISKWLKILKKELFINKITPKGKMPYYISNYESPNFQNKKRLFALKKLYDSGFLNHLSSLKNAKTVIIFGSMARWDWHNQSDIDLFILGDAKELEQGKYERGLKREIQLFTCKDESELKKFNKDLIKSIIQGDIIKGNLDFLNVGVNA